MKRPEVYRSVQPTEGLRLNLNEAAQDIPEELKTEILDRLNGLSWRRYPDGEMKSCRRMIAGWYGLDEESVLIGNGSNELLGAAMLAYTPVAGKIFWMNPGFSMVPKQAAWLGRQLVEEYLSREDFSYPDFTGSTALHVADMVLLTSPNNPSGNCLPPSLFEKLMACYPGPVLIDEAYAEFAETSFVNRLEDFTNLIVLRTFSKAYSLAGGRIGYALSSPEMIRRLEGCKAPFSVGLFQQACIEAVSGSRSWIEKTVRETRTERTLITRELQKLPSYKVIESQANFILFSPGRDRCQALNKRLVSAGIWIRTFEEPCLQDWFRVSVGSAEENQLFVKTVSEFALEAQS